MSKTTIEWAQLTWNPTTGCDPCSSGCARCYAKPQSMRNKAMGLEKYANGFEITMHEEELLRPFKWKRGRIIFVNSMSDLFHPGVTDEFIRKVFNVMNENPQHIFIILTKRAERLAALSNNLIWTDNICMGVSIESMKVIGRLDCLKMCGAQIKILSLEPLLEALPGLNFSGIDQVIVGGESGVGKIRPMIEEWVLGIMQQCKAQNVPFFFKQWGHKKNNPNASDPTIIKSHPQYAKGGCQLQGKIYREFPKSFNHILKPTKMKTTENNKMIIDESMLQNLTPFKKAIGVALQNGESQELLAERISYERKMPLKTAKAFVTMVVKIVSSEIPEPGLHLPPLKKVIAEALVSDEDEGTLAVRLSEERKIPLRSAKAYITIVKNEQNKAA